MSSKRRQRTIKNPGVNIPGRMPSDDPILYGRSTALSSCDPGREKSRRIFLVIALAVVLWSVFLYLYDPVQIVTLLGVRNVYIFVFLLAMIGGVSLFTTTLLYTSLIAISFGGVDPVWLSLSASTGLLSGDLVIYHLSKTGSQCVPDRYGSIITRLKRWTEKYSDEKMIILIFLYSMTPLPSDAISIVLGVSSFPIRKMVLPLILGKSILILVLMELAMLGYSYF